MTNRSHSTTRPPEPVLCTTSFGNPKTAIGVPVRTEEYERQSGHESGIGLRLFTSTDSMEPQCPQQRPCFASRGADTGWRFVHRPHRRLAFESRPTLSFTLLTFSVRALRALFLKLTSGSLRKRRTASSCLAKHSCGLWAAFLVHCDREVRMLAAAGGATTSTKAAVAMVRSIGASTKAKLTRARCGNQDAGRTQGVLHRQSARHGVVDRHPTSRARG